MHKGASKVISIILSFILVFQQSGFAQVAGQLDISGYINQFRQTLAVDKFRPLHLRYLHYNPQENGFRLLLDKGDVKNLNDSNIEQTTKELLNYFFVGVTLPNDSFWVNLRPDSPDNIIDPVLAQTDVGRILLEADLQLKKDTALYTSPQTPEGREYWDKLYQKAGELFGLDNVTIPTLTRPWIVPDEIIVREAQDNAYIYKATLKVMLEQDYLKDSSVYNFKDQRSKQLNEYSSQIIRDLIIPKLTKEVNTSKRYAPLRQVYYSLILAQWFKQQFAGKNNTYSSLIDRKNLTGLASKQDWSKTTYFQAYQKSFKDGEYNIKESVYTPSGQTIRSYFSGGIAVTTKTIASAKSPLPAGEPLGAPAYTLGILASGIPENPVIQLETKQIPQSRTSSPVKEDSKSGVDAPETKNPLQPAEVENVKQELIQAYQDKFGNPSVYIRDYLPVLLAKVKSKEELIAWDNELVSLIQAYQDKTGKCSFYVHAYLPVLLAKVKTREELIVCKELILAYQDKFGSPDSYIRDYLPALLAKVKTREELIAWNDEVMLLIQAYQAKFGDLHSYVEYGLPVLLAKVKTREELIAWNDEVMLLIQAYQAKFGKSSFYVGLCLPVLLAKVKTREELIVCKELILAYQDKFGSPDSYIRDYLPALLAKVKTREELIVCKELILAYQDKFGDLHSYVEYGLPVLLAKVKSREELIVCKDLILIYQAKFGKPYSYVKDCLPALLAKVKTREELIAWNDEVMLLIQAYQAKFGDLHSYVEYGLPVLLAKVKSREELIVCKDLILIYQAKFGKPYSYVKDCLPALLAAIDDAHRDFWLGLIESAIKPGNGDSMFVPADMDVLIEELTKSGSVKEADDAISTNKLLRKHKAYFYRVEGARTGDLLLGEFAKTGTLLATRKEGVVVPVIGDFYLVSRASQADDKIYLDIRRLSDEEIRQRYGLVKLKKPDGHPYELEFFSLRDVVGRLSMFPGSFGWVQIISSGRSEEPLRRPEDLFIPLITGEELAFQPARLEVKGLGTPVIKSLHNVFDESGRPIQIMENQTSQPDPRIIFRLLDEQGNLITTDIRKFLRLPGLLSGTNYQPYFNSPPGLEEADQSQRESANEQRVSTNGVTLPNHALFHWWFKDNLSGTARSYGITLRLAKSDSRALRLHELLYEYEQFGQDSRLGRWRAEGKIPAMLRRFFYRVGLNVTGMNQSQLYLFPNGDERVDESTDNYGAVVREIYGRAVGSLMRAEPAYNMVLNNFCFNGDFADLGEYVNGPGTPDFAIAYILHFMARLVHDFEVKGLLTSQEAKDPQLLAAYLTGVSRLASDDSRYAELKLWFPEPEIFQLDQERFNETDEDGYSSGQEMANYKIKVTDPELSRVLAEIKTSNFINRDLSFSEPKGKAGIFRQGYRLFKSWDEYVLKVLGYPVAADMLTQKALRVFLDDYWKQYDKLGQSQDARELKELFLGLQEAFISQSQVVRYSGQTINLDQAIGRFNYLVKLLRGSGSFDVQAEVATTSAAQRPEPVEGAQNSSSSPATLVSQSAKSLAQVQDQAMHPGGIDFRSLPIVTQSMDSLKASIRAIPQATLERINLTREWPDIERLVDSGITPSVERLKEYLAASCLKGNLDSDMKRIVSCIADILRLEEQRCCSTDPTLKNILVILGLGRTGGELRAAFSGVI